MTLQGWAAACRIVPFLSLEGFMQGFAKATSCPHCFGGLEALSDPQWTHGAATSSRVRRQVVSRDTR